MTGSSFGSVLDSLPADVPRDNGELVFASPWEARAFGLAAAYVEAAGVGWDAFRPHLIAAIADLPDDTPYYEAWVVALENLVAEHPSARGWGESHEHRPPNERPQHRLA